jgi:hypothetical protein
MLPANAHIYFSFSRYVSVGSTLIEKDLDDKPKLPKIKLLNI